MSLLLFLTISCKKEDSFLGAKPNQALAVPSTLADLQNLLNDDQVFNRASDPALGEISSDDFSVQDDAFVALFLSAERNAYTWQNSIYDATLTQVSDWNGPYLMVYYANTILEALPKLSNAGNQAQADQINGAALFYRSYAFYNLVQTFALPYDEATAATIPGVPLRLSSDLNTRPQRASLADCYRQITSDLQAALQLLPVTAVFKTQPSQPAANALLARIYLAIGKYGEALTYANACLNQYPTLTDYNPLNAPGTTSIAKTYVDEDIYHSTLQSYSVLVNRRYSYVDPAFVALYNDHDLRKTKFFTTLDGMPAFPRFVGSYDFKNLKYSGLATDEVYLIKAECQARSGDVTSAMATLNTLLVKRWKASTFIPLTSVSQEDALNQILLERRKELLYRGLRWTDLRRLNKDPKTSFQLQRTVNGITYTLPAGDPRYAMPIPDNEVGLGGTTQNER